MAIHYKGEDEDDDDDEEPSSVIRDIVCAGHQGISIVETWLYCLTFLSGVL